MHCHATMRLRNFRLHLTRLLKKEAKSVTEAELNFPVDFSKDP